MQPVVAWSRPSGTRRGRVRLAQHAPTHLLAVPHHHGTVVQPVFDGVLAPNQLGVAHREHARLQLRVLRAAPLDGAREFRLCVLVLVLVLV